MKWRLKLGTNNPGDELYNYLLQHGALPADKVQRMFAQLVGAVAYIHNLNCVHRDLKLENILLDKHENIKLVDFGFTREYEGKTNYLQTFCGTVCYSAPEMLKGEKYAGEKVDVWSLGIILYALLSGELPFDDDDDLVTKHKILSQDPALPDTFPPEAKTLIAKLLSKRPILRPSLAEILADPFLIEHAPAQQAILKVTKPPPFATQLEKECLQRMRSAGVDIDKVIEHVLAQRCDALAGWWALLLEKQERKERRRERKRAEREAKASRRQSAVSALRVSMLEGVTEEAGERKVDDNPVTPSRGRRERRSFPQPQLVIPDLPRLPEGVAVDSPTSIVATPSPLDKDPMRSASSSRPRPVLPPKDRRRSRSSTLQLVVSSPALGPGNGVTKRRARRRQLGFLSQLASLKHWFVENTKRAKSPNATRSDKNASSTKDDKSSAAASKVNLVQNGKALAPPVSVTKPLPTQAGPSGSKAPYRSNRASLSPAPLTPRSSYRRSSGLRGRKSTSSSVSSIRSIHHNYTHSKTSSTSSHSESVTSSAVGTRTGRSPHASVKVLPATPTHPTLPSNIRLVRASPAPISIPPNYATGGPNPWTSDAGNFRPLSSPGLVFAKRKKTPFRGPMLGSPANGRRSREGSRSGSQPRRHSKLIIEEEEEDEEIEEVDSFSPLGSRVGSPVDSPASAERQKGEPAPGTSSETVRSGWVDFVPGTEPDGETGGLMQDVLAAGASPRIG